MNSVIGHMLKNTLWDRDLLAPNLLGRHSWGTERSKQRAKGGSNCDAVTTEASADPSGSSGAGMVLQKCSKFGKGSWAFICIITQPFKCKLTLVWPREAASFSPWKTILGDELDYKPSASNTSGSWKSDYLVPEKKISAVSHSIHYKWLL